MNKLLVYAKPHMVPAGGYTIRDPDDGYQYPEQATHEQLVNLVKQHRKANKMEVPENISELVMHWICLRLPAEMVIGIRDPKNGPPLRISEGAVIATMNVTRPLFRRISKTVPEELALRRANICQGCQYNTRHAACFSCTGLRDAMSRAVGKKTVVDKHLYVCNKTASLLVGDVQFPRELLKQWLPAGIYATLPDHCWKLECNEKDQSS